MLTLGNLWDFIQELSFFPWMNEKGRIPLYMVTLWHLFTCSYTLISNWQALPFNSGFCLWLIISKPAQNRCTVVVLYCILCHKYASCSKCHPQNSTEHFVNLNADVGLSSITLKISLSLPGSLGDYHHKPLATSTFHHLHIVQEKTTLWVHPWKNDKKVAKWRKMAVRYGSNLWFWTSRYSF